MKSSRIRGMPSPRHSLNLDSSPAPDMSPVLAVCCQQPAVQPDNDFRRLWRIQAIGCCQRRFLARNNILRRDDRPNGNSRWGEIEHLLDAAPKMAFRPGNALLNIGARESQCLACQAE